MTLLAAAIVAAVLGPSLIVLAAAVAVYLRDIRAHQLPGLTEAEARARVAPYTEPIAVSPLRAPRNGTTYDPVE